MRRSLFAVVLAAAVLPSAPAGGQPAPGGIQGVVVGRDTGHRLAGVMVALDAGRRTVTDARGIFVFRDLAAGPYRIAAVAPGCHTALGEVEAPAGAVATIRLEVDLPDPETDSRWTDEERREGAAVRVVEAEDLRGRNLATVLDAVRLVAPDMVGQESAEAGGRQRLRSRSRATLGATAEPLVMIDGVRVVQNVVDVLASMDPDHVQRIEVARGAAAGWRQGMQGANGVIRIYTRDPTTAALLPGSPPEKCGFSFP